MSEYAINKYVDFDELIKSPNICELLDEDDYKHIGRCALEGYDEDRASRYDWERRNADALELALQVVRAKTFPWPNAANVKFPLITMAALQYQARAYPALIDEVDLVKARVYGDDPDGSKTMRAERISSHMTWQNVEQDCGWEEEHDKALLVQPIAGSAFMKRVYDSIRGHQVSRLVLPRDFVIYYWTKDIATSPRYTHVFCLSNNEVRQRELLGTFVEPYEQKSGDKEWRESYEQRKRERLPKTGTQDAGPLKTEVDNRQGLMETQVTDATPYLTGEQYCWWDLDGDGFDEPYIVTFDIGTGCVRRIVARYLESGVKRIRGNIYAKDGSIYEICPVKVFTKIPFIPSPDGGFYDLGLGGLLGPINESVNTALNQIFDAGTMATLGGGFVGRGFKGRGGPFSMRPFEWYPIDAPGDDIHKNILPLPVREPSNVLFQVLGFLVQYAERTVSATDIQLGENPGQNTPAETARTLNENGSRVYSGIYKRTWRAFREEYDIQYDLNGLYLPESEDYENLITGKGALIKADDYRGDSVYVRPSADPYVVSDTMRQQQNTMVMQAANQMPGFNRYQSTLRWLKAMKVPNIEQILPQPMMPGPDGQPMPAPDYPPPPNPKMMELQIKQADQQLKEKTFQRDTLQFQIELQQDIMKTSAEINELNARAEMELAKAGATQADPAIKLIYAQIEAAGMKQEKWLRMLEIVAKHSESKTEGEGGKKGNGQALAGFSAPPQLTNAETIGTVQ